MGKKSQILLISSLIFLILVIVVGVWVFINTWSSIDENNNITTSNDDDNNHTSIKQNNDNTIIRIDMDNNSWRIS